VDVERAVAYVEAHGNVIERARLAAVLWHEPPPEAALQELAALQRPDGGFGRWMPQASDVCRTTYVLHWFDDLKVYRGPIVDPACRFLLDQQQEDGGWDEVEEVRAFNPPEWLIPGRIETRVWLTAHCAHVLLRFGYAEAEGTSCPADFLLAHQDESGRLTGYLLATWVALPTLAFYPGPRSKPFQRALAAVKDNYSPDWTGSDLAWLLRCLKDAGVPASHPLVARSLDDLERKQQPDGSWESGAVGHAASATIEALRELRRYGRIP